MSDSAQRWVSILVGGGVVVLAGWLAITPSYQRAPRSETPTAPSASAAPPAAAVTHADASVEPSPAAAAKEADLDAGLSLGFFAEAGLTMPTGAPRTVRIGVVLVQFQGAEGAPSSARSRRDALTRAQELAENAKTDWKQAVKSGDSGSTEDVGRIPRGVLDPQTEVAVFSLSAGGVSGVLETPRGYWIVKRVE